MDGLEVRGWKLERIADFGEQRTENGLGVRLRGLRS